MAEREGRFRLWKYYLDCVSEDGAVCIGYVARLRWGPLSVGYCALLECDADGTRRERHSYVRVPEPVVSSSEVEWLCEPLGVRGRWSNATVRHEATLLDGEAGRVHWQVLAPRSPASIERPAGPLTGLGYVERLELSIEPWRLPFETLHWGRFHSDADVLIWIGWDGDVRLRHILHNSELLTDARFGERVLHFEPGRELQLLDTRTVREAPVLAALDRLPRALRRVPPSFMAAREVKWLSQARLSNGDRSPANGWALHERVQFR
jgi:hypothetical protein